MLLSSLANDRGEYKLGSVYKFVSSADTASPRMLSFSSSEAVMFDRFSGLTAYCKPMTLKGVSWTTHSCSTWKFKSNYPKPDMNDHSLGVRILWAFLSDVFHHRSS